MDILAMQLVALHLEQKKMKINHLATNLPF